MDKNFFMQPLVTACAFAQNNPLVNLTFAQAEAYIDKADDIPALKKVIKRVVRLLLART